MEATFLHGSVAPTDKKELQLWEEDRCLSVRVPLVTLFPGPGLGWSPLVYESIFISFHALPRF